MHTQGNQLVLELLLKLSDTLHKQYRYIEHVHEEVSCQKSYFCPSDCLSNLVILYGLCIPDSSFCHTCFSMGYLGVQVSVGSFVRSSVNIYPGCFMSATPLTVLYRSF